MTNDFNTGYLILFLPWIHFPREYQMGNITFWPWPEQNNQRIHDQRIADKLSEIFSCYSRYNSEEIDKLTVISVDNDSFDMQNKERFAEAADATRLLAFSCISANEYFERLGRYANASAFEIVGQQFVFGDDGVTMSSRRRDGKNLDFGYSTSTLRIIASPWVSPCRIKQSDEELLKALSTIATLKEKAHRRILNAIRWFLLSYSDSPTMSNELEIACLHTAFENLEPGQTNTQWLRNLFQGSREAAPSRIVGKEKTAFNTWREAWYYAFQGLRNDLLHGDLNPKTGPWNVSWHLFIGSVMFVSSVKRILEQHDLYTRTLYDEVRENVMDDFIANPDRKSWGLLHRHRHKEMILSHPL